MSKQGVGLARAHVCFVLYLLSCNFVSFTSALPSTPFLVFHVPFLPAFLLAFPLLPGLHNAGSKLQSYHEVKRTEGKVPPI